MANKKEAHHEDSPVVRAAKSGGAKGAATARRHLIHRLGLDKHMSGFMEFVRKQGVVGLAVGLAIGTQAGELVKNIVSSIITPFVDLLVGQGGLRGLTWYVSIGDRSTTFNFGLLIDSIIKFLAVALVIYFVVMGLKLDKLDIKKEKA